MTKSSRPSINFKRQVIDGERFWRDEQPGYATLSYLSDPDDWASIISAISTHIAESVEDRDTCRILDVGSGLGTTSYNIMKRLLASFNVSSQATLVEPSDEARSFSRLLFSNSDHRFGTAVCYENISQVGESEKYDAVLFIHSSYYIRDLEGTISAISERHLKTNGRIIFLVLPGISNFFLGLADHGYPNCSEEVIAICKSLNLKTSVHNMTSRVRVPNNLWQSKDVVANWARFFEASAVSVDELQRLLRVYITDGADLRDKLIIAER